jgi:predicted DNA-binding transcriptional regulator AlpA
MNRALSDARPVPRRGLSREEAAMYIGISPSKFDELVGDGRMPAPVKIDGRKVWDLCIRPGLRSVHRQVYHCPAAPQPRISKIAKKRSFPASVPPKKH